MQRAVDQVATANTASLFLAILPVVILLITATADITGITTTITTIVVAVAVVERGM